MADILSHTTSSLADSNKLVDSSEKMLSISQAARNLPAVRGKKSPHPNTLVRWARVGLRSKSGKIVRLDIQRVGGTNCTSMAALQRFFDALHDAEEVTTFRMHTENRQSFDTQVTEALKALKERGFLRD
jgi:hypothetical protein